MHIHKKHSDFLGSRNKTWWEKKEVLYVLFMMQGEEND